MNDYSGIQAYRRTDLQSVGKEKLIVLLYQKMIEHLDRAAALAETDRPEMSRRLNLTQRIVTELQNALDFAVGGEIAENLSALYDFVFREILQMQVDRDARHAVNCREVLQPLLDAWQTIPPGVGERELHRRDQPGTDRANGESTIRDESPSAEPSISVSA
jgi:flagellar protein FliS